MQQSKECFHIICCPSSRMLLKSKCYILSVTKLGLLWWHWSLHCLLGVLFAWFCQPSQLGTGDFFLNIKTNNLLVRRTLEQVLSRMWRAVSVQNWWTARKAGHCVLLGMPYLGSIFARPTNSTNALSSWNEFSHRWTLWNKRWLPNTEADYLKEDTTQHCSHPICFYLDCKRYCLKPPDKHKTFVDFLVFQQTVIWTIKIVQFDLIWACSAILNKNAIYYINLRIKKVVHFCNILHKIFYFIRGM